MLPEEVDREGEAAPAPRRPIRVSVRQTIEPGVGVLDEEEAPAAGTDLVLVLEPRRVEQERPRRVVDGQTPGLLAVAAAEQQTQERPLVRVSRDSPALSAPPPMTAFFRTRRRDGVLLASD